MQIILYLAQILDKYNKAKLFNLKINEIIDIYLCNITYIYIIIGN